jgi:hypothetical protein
MIVRIQFISLLPLQASKAHNNVNNLNNHVFTIMSEDIITEEALPATTPRYQYEGTVRLSPTRSDLVTLALAHANVPRDFTPLALTEIHRGCLYLPS